MVMIYEGEGAMGDYWRLRVGSGTGGREGFTDKNQ